MSKAIKVYSPKEYVKRIREEKSLIKAIKILMDFGEVYRKAYTAAKSREYFSIPQNRDKLHKIQKKYRDANKEQLNFKRRKGTSAERPPNIGKK